MLLKEWFIFSLAALVMWGLWAFFSKLTTRYLSPKSALLYEVAGWIIVGGIVLWVIRFQPEIHPQGILFGLLTGIVGILGTLFFLYAVTKGQTSLAVTTTALYPLLTIILAFLILKENITLLQGIGMVLALIAMVLFTL